MGETKEKRLEHSTFSTALEDTDWSFETIHETMHSGTFHFEVWLLAGALNPWPIFRKRRSHQCDCSCGSTKLPVFCLERKAAVSSERAPSLGETLWRTCDNATTLGFDFDAFVHRPAVLCWFTLEVPLPYERAHLPLPAQGNLGVDISSQLVELAWFWWSCPYVMWVSLGVTCIFLILYLFFLYLCPASCIFLCFISASWFLEISLDGDLYLRLLLDYTFIYYITFLD